MPRYPKIGVQYDFRLPQPEGRRRSWAEFADVTLGVCRELDAVGVDGLWLSEHHFVDDGYLPALLPMAAALAVTTSRCDIGTSVLLAPLHHPVALAEAAAVVDNLSHGRLILGLGLGYRGDELAAFGVRKQERGRRMDETLEILAQCWSEGPLDFAGEFFTLPAVDVVPKPWQRPPRLWLGARSDPAAGRAGRWANGVILGSSESGPVRATFLAAAQAAGRDPTNLEVAVFRSTVLPDLVGPDHVAEITAGLHARTRTYGEWFARAGDLPQDRGGAPTTAVAPQLHRSVAQELEELEALAAAGITYVIYHGTAPGVDPRLCLPQWSRIVAETRTPQEAACR